MAVYKDEAEAAERPEGEHVSNEDAAVSAQDQWKVLVSEKGSDLAGKIYRELPYSLPVYYRGPGIYLRRVGRRRYAAAVERIQAGYNAPAPEGSRELADAGFLARPGRPQAEIRGGVDHGDGSRGPRHDSPHPYWRRRPTNGTAGAPSKSNNLCPLPTTGPSRVSPLRT